MSLSGDTSTHHWLSLDGRPQADLVAGLAVESIAGVPITTPHRCDGENLGATLLTGDGRASGVYQVVDVTFEFVG